jgi:formylglycine-generating enzyme required for sulfatase activity
MAIAFKFKMALVCVAGFASSLAVGSLLTRSDVTDTILRTRQAIVALRGGTVSYRLAGDFSRGGRQVEAPLVEIQFPGPFSIMKNRVSAADYQHCVEDGACRALDREVVIATDHPAVQVSWYDADDYAGWLMRKTGETYRLPTDAEWTYAAERQFGNGDMTADNAGTSYLRVHHEHDANRQLAGSGQQVWEWTNTCFVRIVLNENDVVVSKIPNCGVRVVEGEHRAYVTDFVRDGGCEFGTPPDSLGFRLVREEKVWTAPNWSKLGPDPVIALGPPAAQSLEFQAPPNENRTLPPYSTF